MRSMEHGANAFVAVWSAASRVNTISKEYNRVLWPRGNPKNRKEELANVALLAHSTNTQHGFVQ